MPLTETKIKALKPKSSRYQVADGGGLGLEVMPTGRKVWRYSYRINGNQSRATFGDAPSVPLVKARAMREEAKVHIASGMNWDGKALTGNDPAGAAGHGTTSMWSEPTWDELLDRFLEIKEREGRDPKTITKLRHFANLTKPHIGHLPPREITRQQFVALCRHEEDKGHVSTARRVKALCSAVTALAMAEGLVEHDATAHVGMALARERSKPFAAILEPARVGRLMLDIDGYEGSFVTRCALQLTALTWLRSTELRLGEWTEIDWDEALWTIPEAGRMKAIAGQAARKHVVPLSQQAVGILRMVQRLTGRDRFIFTSPSKKDRPISNMTMNNALKSLGYSSDQHVPHGFRRTASTNLNEQGWNADWIEAQLAHVEGNKVRRAYNAAEYLPQRREMMQHYADWLDEGRTQAAGS